MRKQNIPFGILIELSPDATGLAATFLAKYRLQNATGEWTTLPGTFVELKPGTYELAATFTTVGTYNVLLESSDASIDSNSMVLVIGKASIDDVYDVVTAASTEIGLIKDKVNSLDTTALSTIQSGVSNAISLLNELSNMVGNTEVASITALKDLLIAIGNSEDAQTGLINAIRSISDGIKEILMGQDQFLADGTTPNPNYQATNVELKALIVASVDAMKADITAAQAAIIADAQATRDLIVTKLTGVKTVVDANATLLGDSTAGLVAIRAVLDQIATNTAGGTNTIIDALNNAENGLAVLKAQTVSILTAIAGVDTKVSSIATDVTALKAAGGASTKISVVM